MFIIGKIISVDMGFFPLQEAIAADSLLPPKTIWKGDVSEGHSNAPHSLEGEFRVGGQEHFYLETNAHLAVPGECGQMEIFR